MPQPAGTGRRWQSSALPALLVVLAAGASSCRPPAGASVPPDPPAVAVVFRDVAQAAGIRTQWGHHGKSPLSNLESFGAGCAFIDYNNDGWLDLLLIAEPAGALYRNRRDGTFEDVTRASGLAQVRGPWKGCAVGDYDNDGWPDLFLTGFHDGVLLRNNHGRFERVPSGIRHRGWGSSAVFADFDGDGRLDLFVGNYVQFGPGSLKYCTFGHGVKGGCPPRVYPAEHGVMYRNGGSGTFRDVTHAWGLDASAGKNLGVAAGDYDDDGRTDLYVANDGVPGDLFHNDGGGHFSNVAMITGTAYGVADVSQAGMGVDWGDYDRDGRMDLVVSAFADEMYSLYHNDGGTFRNVSVEAGIGPPTLKPLGFGAKFFDADNDGWLDLIFANGHVYDRSGEIDPATPYREPLQFFLNTRDGRFRELSASAGEAFRRPIVGRGLAVGDYDNDGSLDVLVVDYEGKPLLLHNETPAAGHFASIRLEQPGLNRSAFGARLWATLGPTRSVADVNPGGSYLSASDSRVHLGIGPARKIDRLEIRWPDGGREILNDLLADQFLVVRRGHGWSAEKRGHTVTR